MIGACAGARRPPRYSGWSLQLPKFSNDQSKQRHMQAHLFGDQERHVGGLRDEILKSSKNTLRTLASVSCTLAAFGSRVTVSQLTAENISHLDELKGSRLPAHTYVSSSTVLFTFWKRSARPMRRRPFADAAFVLHSMATDFDKTSNLHSAVSTLPRYAPWGKTGWSIHRLGFTRH